MATFSTVRKRIPDKVVSEPTFTGGTLTVKEGLRSVKEGIRAFHLQSNLLEKRLDSLNEEFEVRMTKLEEKLDAMMSILQQSNSQQPHPPQTVSGLPPPPLLHQNPQPQHYQLSDLNPSSTTLFGAYPLHPPPSSYPSPPPKKPPLNATTAAASLCILSQSINHQNPQYSCFQWGSDSPSTKALTTKKPSAPSFPSSDSNPITLDNYIYSSSPQPHHTPLISTSPLFSIAPQRVERKEVTNPNSNSFNSKSCCDGGNVFRAQIKDGVVVNGEDLLSFEAKVKSVETNGDDTFKVFDEMIEPDNKETNHVNEMVDVENQKNASIVKEENVEQNKLRNIMEEVFKVSELQLILFLLSGMVNLTPMEKVSASMSMGLTPQCWSCRHPWRWKSEVLKLGKLTGKRAMSWEGFVTRCRKVFNRDKVVGADYGHAMFRVGIEDGRSKRTTEGGQQRNYTVPSESNEFEEDNVFFFDTQDFLSSSSFKSSTAGNFRLESDDDEKLSISSVDGFDSSVRPWSFNYSYIKRREKLPDPVEKEKGMSLWSMIKDSIVKDLTKVCLPVYFNEPISSLQKCFEDLEYSYLLDRAYEWGKNGLMRKAFGICIRMVDKGNALTILTYNTLSKGFCMQGSMDDALVLQFSMLKRGIMPNEISCSTLLDGFIKVNDFERAMKLWNDILARGLAKNQITFNTMINGFCKMKRMANAEIEAIGIGNKNEKLYDFYTLSRIEWSPSEGLCSQIHRKTNWVALNPFGENRLQMQGTFKDYKGESPDSKKGKHTVINSNIDLPSIGSFDFEKSELLEEDSMSMELGLVFFEDGTYSRGPVDIPVGEFDESKYFLSPIFKFEQCLVKGCHKRLRIVHTIEFGEGESDIQIIRVAIYEEQWISPVSLYDGNDDQVLDLKPISQRRRTQPSVLSGPWKVFEVSATPIFVEEEAKMASEEERNGGPPYVYLFYNEQFHDFELGTSSFFKGGGVVRIIDLTIGGYCRSTHHNQATPWVQPGV